MTDWITRDQVERIVDQYLNSKAPKFRTKALITYRLAEEIKQVLSSTSPYCEIGTASFRHWARTRFLFNEQYELCFKNVKSTSNDNSISLIGKPVGLKEDLYEILTTAHQNCHHRGRDVTYEQVKKRHSLVPKQLCDMVVKACSYCNGRKERLKLKRNNQQISMDTSSTSSNNFCSSSNGTCSESSSDELLSLATAANSIQDGEKIMYEIIELYYA